MNVVKWILDKEMPTLLGRWRLDYCPKVIKYKVKYANVDHCGTCSQPVPKKEQTKNKIIDLE